MKTFFLCWTPATGADPHPGDVGGAAAVAAGRRRRNGRRRPRPRRRRQLQQFGRHRQSGHGRRAGQFLPAALARQQFQEGTQSLCTFQLSEVE